MYTDGFEQLIKLNKNLTGPLSECNKASSEILQRMTQRNLELMSENFSNLSDQLKRLSTAKKPEDFFAIQRECINEDVSMVMETFNKMVRTSMLGMEEFSKLFSSYRDMMPVIKEKEKGSKNSK